MELIKTMKMERFILHLALLLCFLQSSRAMKPQQPSQTLSIKDSKTDMRVHLIGSMHYNPYSISKTEQIIAGYGDNDELGSVMIESCAKRWTRTLDKQPQGSFLRTFLDNEMQAAAEIGAKYENVALLLGDQEIEVTNSRMKESFIQSLKDVINPSRWSSLSEDLKRGYTQVNPANPSEEPGKYLGAKDFLDINLLLNAPLSLLRYPLAIVFKSPVVGALLIGTVLASSVGADGGVADTSLTTDYLDLLGGLLGSVLEVVLLGRTFLIALLLERNVVIVDNIRAECERAKKAGEDKVCVVVLGMAHLNGVSKLLSE